MATPQNGTMTLAVGTFRKNINFYGDDATLHYVTFAPDGKADANAPAFYYVPAPGFWITDIVTPSAMATVTTWIIKINDQPVGVLQVANHASTITFRPNPGIAVHQGDKLSMQQVT
jgi:hypothetical protein